MSHPTPRRVLIQALRAATLVISVGSAHQTFAQTPEIQIQQRHYQIPAGALGTALARFAAEANITLSFESSQTQGLTSSGLNGEYNTATGLAQLLAGSGLEAVHRGNGNYILRPASQAGGSVLPSVKVSASGLENATTESTGSYTTASMNSATKLDLSIRETPQSVTVMTRQRLDDEGIVDMVDVIEKAPGLSVYSYGTGRPQFFARGFALDTVTENGISNSFSSYVPSPLGNLAMYDRAEIVRGATGLLQGAGNPSAAVNLIRKLPSAQFQAHINTSVGSWNDLSVTGDVSGPVVQDGKIRGRVVGYFQDADNFRDEEKEERRMVYGTADFDATPNTVVNVGYSVLDTFTNIVWGGIPLSPTGEHLNIPRSTYVGADWEYLKQDVKTLYASINHRFSDRWSLQLNAKYANTLTQLLGTWLMADEENGGYAHIDWAAEDDTDQLGADIYLSGLIQLWGKNHELAVGASTNKEDANNIEFFDCFEPSCGVSAGYDIFNPNPSIPVEPVLSYDNPDRTEATSEVSQRSVYSSMRWHLTKRLKLITGLRLDWYKNRGRWAEEAVKESAQPSFYGGAIYDFHANHSVYFSYTDVFKPQEYLDIQQKQLDPVVGENYELGVKGEYFNGLLNTAIALYRIDQTNLAKALDDQSPCPTFPSSSCYEASGLVRSEGIDLEIQGELIPGWEIGTGFTYSHTEYLKDSDPENIGQRLDTGVPERLFKLHTTYSLNKWRIGSGAVYQSEIYQDLETDIGAVRNRQKAYVLLDLMAGYRFTDHLNLQLRVNNLLDKTYYKAIANNLTYSASEMYGEPRNFMASVEYRF
jgi:TonB-dependent siderophore receptor